VLGGVLDAAHHQRVLGRVPRDPDHEQIAESLVEDHLGRHPRVGAPEDGGVRLLLLRERHAPDALIDIVRTLALDVALVARHELLQRRLRGGRPLVREAVLTTTVRRRRCGARATSAARRQRRSRAGCGDGHP
jgi:hypothetical protein